MRISEQGLTLIRQSEGFSACQYICPAGKPTIGYGHVILPGETYPEEGITEEKAEILLIHDIFVVEQAVISNVTVQISQNELDALVSFTYNIGIKAFEKSTLLRLLNEGYPDKAALEFKRWVYGGGKRLEGLVLRRTAETAVFTGNPYVAA